MAFTPEEKQLILWGKANGKTQEEVEQAIGRLRTGQTTTQPEAQPESNGLKDFATGFAKGGVQSAVETAGYLQKVGQAGLNVAGAVLGQEPKAETMGFPSLQEPQMEQLRELLKAENTAEKAGKVTEFLAELVFPVGKTTEVSSAVKGIVGKGAEIVEPVITKGVERAKQAPSKIGSFLKNIGAKIFQQPIPEQVKTALSETPSKLFDEYTEIGQRAAQSYKNPTPLEKAGQRAQEALGDIQDKLSETGSRKQDMLGIGGVGTTPVDGKIVKDFTNRIQSFKNSVTATEGDKKLINDILVEAKSVGENPAAIQVDRFVDFVQDKIYTSGRDLTVPVTDKTTAALRRFVGELNTKLKNQLPNEYKTVNDEYSKLVEIRNELNTKLGKEGEKGGALMKRVFSPSDANTKKLFDEVKQITGIDLVDEATVARFVMETMGDSRQASLLQQLQLPNLSDRGMLQLARELLAKKFNTPQEILKRARELTTEIPKGKGAIPQTTGQQKITNPKNFKGAEGLDPVKKNIESRAFEYITKNEDSILETYKQKYGKVINADNFRPLFKEIGYTDGSLSAAVQEPVSYLSKRARIKALENPGKFAIAFSGGSGTGKTSAVQNIPEVKELMDKSAMILDSNFSSLSSALKFLKEVKNSGKEFVGVFVYRDILDALANGIVKRMINNKEEMGRIVPNKITAQNHIGSWNVVQKLVDRGYKFIFIDNSLGQRNARLVSLSQLKSKIKYPNSGYLKEILDTKIKELSRQGIVKPNQAKAYVE